MLLLVVDRKDPVSQLAIVSYAVRRGCVCGKLRYIWAHLDQ